MVKSGAGQWRAFRHKWQQEKDYLKFLPEQYTVKTIVKIMETECPDNYLHPLQERCFGILHLSHE